MSTIVSATTIPSLQSHWMNCRKRATSKRATSGRLPNLRIQKARCSHMFTSNLVAFTPAVALFNVYKRMWSPTWSGTHSDSTRWGTQTSRILISKLYSVPERKYLLVACSLQILHPDCQSEHFIVPLVQTSVRWLIGTTEPSGRRITSVWIHNRYLVRKGSLNTWADALSRLTLWNIRQHCSTRKSPRSRMTN